MLKIRIKDRDRKEQRASRPTNNKEHLRNSKQFLSFPKAN